MTFGSVLGRLGLDRLKLKVALGIYVVQVVNVGQRSLALMVTLEGLGH